MTNDMLGVIICMLCLVVLGLAVANDIAGNKKTFWAAITVVFACGIMIGFDITNKILESLS